MNLNFSYYMPTRIIFGQGTLQDLASMRYLPGQKALIVIGSSGAMRENGYLDRVTSYLKTNGVKSVIYDKIQPNPVSEHVEEGAAMAEANKCDFVIGLGGGSSIDSAKSIALMAQNPGSYWDYIKGGSGKEKTPENSALPIVAIPTTAGTGSEADPWTVITKSGCKEKIGWGVDSTFPVLSVVDPELTISVPAKITAHTGMDAFFHAVETYLAISRQPASDHLALEAIELITEYLPIAVMDGSNIKARTYLAWASTAAGICECLSSCISHHSIEHAITAHHPEIAHGAGLAMLSTAYFSFLAKKAPNRFPEMARAMGEDIDTLPEQQRPFAFITALKKLIANIGLEDECLSKHGVEPRELKEIAENSLYTMDGLYEVTPADMSANDVISILEQSC